MPNRLTISLSVENLSTGPAEETATFGLFAITANDRLQTEGIDLEHQELRHGPYISGYPLAEWFAWNWWRIRWELGHPSNEEAARRWDFAHRLSTVGDGYAWPNIAIFSDGIQSFLHSEPSRNPDEVLFRYFGASRRETVPAIELEITIDGFVEDILTRLEGRDLRVTNLHRLWNELRVEREDPELARFRRLEAQLGRDPDEVNEGSIHRHLRDAATLGEEALGEMAADTALQGYDPDRMISAEDITRTAYRCGFDADPNDVIRLNEGTDMPRPGEVEAWRMGVRAARALRDQEHLDGQPISDGCLAEFAGTTRSAITESIRRSDHMSFALDRDDGGARVSLRPKWETGRRFELARLIGDRLLGSQVNRPAEPLFPATRSYSYRQKTQRAFAAELLSPFASVDEMLGGDYSEEKQNDAAEHFNVAPMTIQTQLLNNRRISYEEAPDIVGRGAVA